MRNLILSTILLFGLSISPVNAQDHSKEISSLKTEISSLKTKQERLSNDIVTLVNKNTKSESRISSLESENAYINAKVDSLQNEYNKLQDNQKADKNELTTIIGQTNDKVQATEDILSSRTLWGTCGIILLILALLGTVVSFLKKFKSGSISIDEIKKAQSSLEGAQKVMQEKSVELDTKLLDIFDKQLKVIEQNQTSSQSQNSELDHSLVIKLANEIAKIETNLSKMEKSVRGYKQLVQAKDKMINNVTAYGYEIISLIGQEYNDGMQFPARFVPDESLEEGKRIITGMVKMQVNFKGKMIQAAEIVVNQNI